MTVRLFCKRGEDRLVDALRDIFGAHPVRVPESRIAVNTVLAGYGGEQLFYRGKLDPLVEGDYVTPDHVFATSDVSGLFSTRSRDVDTKLGLDLLEGFVSGFGLSPAMPSLEATARKATGMWFSFHHVKRRFIDIGVLSRLLGNRSIVQTAATEPFFNEENPVGMFLVDSTLMSPSFTIGLTSTRVGGVSLDVGALKKLVGDASASVHVAERSGSAITFEGDTALTFAFTCKEIDLDATGRIRSFDENRGARFLSAGEPTPQLREPRYIARLESGVPAPADVMVEIAD